jgi:hypothetical protein
MKINDVKSKKLNKLYCSDKKSTRAFTHLPTSHYSIKDENDTYAFTRMKEFVQINFEVTYNFQLSTLPRLPRC